MIARLVVIGMTGVALMGYAPRWLSTSSQSWTIWLLAIGLVIGGPRLLSYGLRRAGGRVRSRHLRRP